MVKRFLRLFFLGRIREELAKKLFMDSPRIGLRTLLEMKALSRPAHVYCMLCAAELAARLNIPKISVLEFGVAGGRTLRIAEKFAERISRETGVAIELYGFDTSVGLPEVVDHRDLPHWFKPGQYVMDFDKLQAQLKFAKLVIGNIDQTIDSFAEKYRPAPIGAIFCDVDLYSSTKSVLRLFDLGYEFLMPRAFWYLDDVLGTELEMYNEFNGELLAIDEFNKENENKKIALNRNLLHKDLDFKYQIFYSHIFDHPRYNDYVGGREQQDIMKLLKTN